MKTETLGKLSYFTIAGGVLVGMVQSDAPLPAYIIISGMFGLVYAFHQWMEEF